MWFSRRRPVEAPTASPAPGPVRRDWAELPAIQTIAPGIEGTVDTDFDADLSSWRSPGLLRPLDHALSSDGPSGVVLDSIVRPALPRPVVATPAPVQRSVTFDVARPPAAVFSPAVGVDAEPVVEAEVEPLPEPTPEIVAPTLGAAPVVEAPGAPPVAPVPPMPPEVAVPPRPLGLGPPRPPSIPSRPVQRAAVDHAPSGAPAAAVVETPDADATVDGPMPEPESKPVTAAVAPEPTLEPEPDTAPLVGEQPVLTTAEAEPIEAPVARSADQPAPAPAPRRPGLGEPWPVVQRQPVSDAPEPEPEVETEVEPPSAPLLGSSDPITEPVNEELAAAVELAPASTSEPAGDDATAPLTSAVPPLLTTATPPEPDLTPETPAPTPSPAAPLTVSRLAIDEPSRAPSATGEEPVATTAASLEPVESGESVESVEPSPPAAVGLVGDHPLAGASSAPPEHLVTPQRDQTHRRREMVPSTVAPGTAPLAGTTPAVSVSPQRVAATATATTAMPPTPLPMTTPVLSGGRGIALGPEPGPGRSRAAAPAVQRAVATPLTPAPARAPIIGEPLRPESLTTFAPAPALEPEPEPRSWTDAGTVAVAAGVAQRHADGSVVFSSPPPRPDDDPVADENDEHQVQRAASTESSTTPAPTPPEATTPPAAATGADTTDLDELAKRLYGRLRVMLKHELRLDRERAGVLTQGRR